MPLTSLRRLGATLSATALLGLAPAAAWSAQPSVESIETLLAITQSERLLETANADVERYMRGGIQNALQGRQPTPRQQQAIDQMVRDSAAIMRQDLQWAQLRPLFVQIYQTNFTQEEIDGQIAFYRSPTGAAVVQKMPAVMQATMGAMQQRMAVLMPKLQAVIQKAAAEAQAAEKAAPAPGATKP